MSLLQDPTLVHFDLRSFIQLQLPLIKKMLHISLKGSSFDADEVYQLLEKYTRGEPLQTISNRFSYEDLAFIHHRIIAYLEERKRNPQLFALAERTFGFLRAAKGTYSFHAPTWSGNEKLIARGSGLSPRSVEDLKKHNILSFSAYQKQEKLSAKLRIESRLEVDFLMGKGFAPEITLSMPLAQIHPYFGYCDLSSPTVSCDLSEVVLGSIVKRQYDFHAFLWIHREQLEGFPAVRYTPKHLYVKFTKLFGWYEMIGE